MRLVRLGSATLLSVSLMACTAGPSDDIGNDPPLADLGELLEGAPKSDDLDRIYDDKADGILPARFSELRELQSPVKSQGRRGVCSIFSTVALMEHLYIAEGTLSDPDFSEQYLQWSAKFQVGAFPDSSGSNAASNLAAISGYGIPEESAWPYEIDQWGVANDPACDGEKTQPTRCYTNGEPPASAVEADKFKLPSGRYISNWDIKAHLFTQRTGVVVGMPFFYQSWNHRKSPLPTNSDYWDQGYVLYPNAEDETESRSEELSAGHSILLIGWDDELEVQKVDGEGNKITNAAGEPVMERGFYIFKNSWGTEGFGIDHELGPGYGYISQEYVRRHASARISALPDLGPRPEVCDDGRDNDRNGASDCDDAACFGAEACGGTGGAELVFDSTDSVAIPDNSQVGISQVIDIAETGSIATLAVDLDIEHTFRGDLTVTLEKGGRQVILHDRTGGAADDLETTFVVRDFDGEELMGTWTLHVRDTAAIDVGTLNRWSIRAQVE